MKKLLNFLSFTISKNQTMAGKSFLYEQIAHKIEASISKLNLKGGDQIPSVRTVSKEMNVSLNTVFQAYSILEAKGLIISRPRSG